MPRGLARAVGGVDEVRADLKPEDKARIVGELKAAGARVIVTSRDRSKFDRALALGADAAVHSTSEDIAKTVLAHTGGRGVDVVIENVGAAVWGAALKSLVRGGRIGTCGATTGDQPGADLRRLFIRQLQVFGSTLGTLAANLVGAIVKDPAADVLAQVLPRLFSAAGG